MKQTLFEFVILLHPNLDDETNAGKTTIVVDRTAYLATDEKVVRLYAAKQIPAELDGELDQIEILVRKF